MNNDSKSNGTIIDKTEENKFLEFECFKEFYEKLQKTLKETVQTSNNLFKSNDDLNYYLSFPDFVNSLKNENARLLKIISSLLKFQCLKKPNQICSDDLDVDEKSDLVIDSNDQLIERLGIQLDEIEGLRKKTETELNLTTIYPTNRNIITSWNKETGMVQKTTLARQPLNKVISKPQQFFKDKIDNSYLPSIPKIRVKQNAISSLPEIFKKLDEIEINQKLFDDYPELLINPYLPELEILQVSDEFLNVKDPIKPLKLDETEYEYIDTNDLLIKLKQELLNRDKIKEIAVDLEHHNQRTYLGFTCLMQISTRYKDYIIDTIALRDKINILNEIFTDSTLLKVLHGSDSDIEWLQKDFGIYVVNMFDTGQASRLLQYPHFSLSFLLMKFCNVQAQKQYQMSDWRQRPLNNELINYAREDTHYLLYIYDNLRNDLIKQQLIKLCFDKSKFLCKKTYKKPIFYSNNYLNICTHSEHLNSKQIKCLELLYEWRDRISRENDESCEYVLKNHQLLKIAELLPREIYGILALCNPVSHIVEANLHQIHEIVLKARDYKIENQLSNLNGNDVDRKQQQETKVKSFIHLPLFDPNSILNCPHDSAHFNNKNDDQNITSDNALNTLENENRNFNLIKPNKIDLIIPDNFIFINKTNLFVENIKTEENINNKNKKRKLKLINKINEIKTSMKNPFEKYLSKELRKEIIDDNDKWTLLRASTKGIIINKIDESLLIKPKVEDLPDDNLIPLKVQLKQQRNEDNNDKVVINKTPKKMKKLIKELELKQAIEERNRIRENEFDSESLGNKINQDALAANLAIIAENAKSNNFSYDDQNLNKIFNKSSNQNNNNNIYDPTSKLKHVKFGRVTKKQFNKNASISRSKNNRNATFKD